MKISNLLRVGLLGLAGILNSPKMYQKIGHFSGGHYHYLQLSHSKFGPDLLFAKFKFIFDIN
jgi:hypothetical protein